MMDYVEVRFQVKPSEEYITDVLSAFLVGIGYESFVPDSEGMAAYVSAKVFDEPALKGVLETLPVEADIVYTYENIKGQNWNEEWEKNYFRPIVISDRCVVHSTFHRDIPVTEYDILIDPKMSFGTGHHETTNLMLEEVLGLDLVGKSVLDMGCGTAVLAILAVKKGATYVEAIDIDVFAYENACENIVLNQADIINVKKGGAELLNPDKKFDVLLANINRNILLQDMSFYVSSMGLGSELYMSGFYEADISVIRERAEELGLKYVHYHTKNNWVAVKFVK